MNNSQNLDDHHNLLNDIVKEISLLLLSISVKFGIKSMDYVASLLHLNDNGIPLSQQSYQDAIKHISELTQKLQNPQFREQLKLYIQQLEPIIQDFIQDIFNHILDIINNNEPKITAIIKDGLLDIPIVGMFISLADIATKFVEIFDDLFIHGTEFAQKINGTYQKIKNLQQNTKFTGGKKNNKIIQNRLILSIQHFFDTNKF